jgi:FKBP-type peptidyl-prolyl cis-trans isomerase FklB
MAYQAEQRTKLEEGAKVAGDKNKKEGEAFLALNKKQPGVVTLPSGLQYKVLVEGKGKMPKLSSTVTTQYSGKLLDGTEFDSSYKRGEAATFPCSGVIKGWTEALQLMKEGSKWELYVPPDLAYGPAGTGGGAIPPNATLIFQVELISVK